MTNAHLELGVSIHANAQEIHEAYIKKVKQWHPDNFQDINKQNQAQEMLIKINLAYKELMNNTKFGDGIVYKDLKEHIRKLYKLKQYESALLYLNKDPDRNADWYFTYGSVLHEQKKFKEAHDCFRKAISIEPDSKQYRQAALEAHVQFRKSTSFIGKISQIFKK